MSTLIEYLFLPKTQHTTIAVPNDRKSQETKTNEPTVDIDNRTRKKRNEMVYMMDDAIQYIRSVESIELPTPKMTTDEGIVNKIVVDSASMSHVWLTVFDKLANEKGHVMQYKFKAFQNKNK